jgi:hypothetical protein
MVYPDVLVEAGALQALWGVYGHQHHLEIILPVFPLADGPTEYNGNTLLVPMHRC